MTRAPLLCPTCAGELVRISPDGATCVRGHFVPRDPATGKLLARRDDERGEPAQRPVPPAGDDDASQPPATRDHAPEHGEDCTDWQNARILAELLREEALYVEAWGWCVWDGYRWVRDPDGARVAAIAAERLSSYYLERALAAGASPARQRYAEYAIRVQSRARVSAALDLARGLLLARPDEFDRNAWELNVLNGILDLRSGTLRTRTPHDRVTKLAPVTYRAGADWQELAPTWCAFVERVLPDSDVRRFVQELSGIALTGDTSEHLFPVHWGGGANGKSTLIRALFAVLGDYAIQTAPELVARKHDRHPTELADLLGVRLAVTVELDEGARLAEALLKQLTGGDRIRARFMHRDFFEFAPTHKLWLVTNHRPVIRGTDHAIWRRVLLIPYTVTIPEDERDPRLPERLVAERDGILLWMLEGLQRYLQHGLQVPDAVRVATAQYRREQDILADWIESCCVLDPQAVTPFRELYASYTAWCEEQAESPMSSRRFADRLTERGFAATPLPGNARVKARAGIRLRRDHEPETPEPDHHEDSSSEDASTTDRRDTRSPISPIAPKIGKIADVYRAAAKTPKFGEIGEIGEVGARATGRPIQNSGNSHDPPLERRRCPVCRQPYEVRVTDRPGWVQVRCGCRGGSWDWVRASELMEVSP
ncbi:hypothetical protein HRbin28_00004 [bacterium HR28]|nr:hypothetical protein HRbin28_00004 [bacterium HR28]